MATKKPPKEKPEPPRILLPATSKRARRIKKYIEKYCPVPEGMLVGQQMVLLPEQDDFIERVYGNVDETGKLITRTGIFSVARKNGKALAVDTPIPTPRGFVTMGALRVGDKVFDDTGRTCTITFKSKVFHKHKCFRVEFADGTSAVADAEHTWAVFRRGRKTALVERTTAQLLEAGVLTGGSRNSYAWCVPVLTNPVEYPLKKELPLSPYILGLWLGDGASRSASISVGYSDLKETVSLIEQELFPDFRYKKLSIKEERTCARVLLSDGKDTRSSDTVHKRLRELGGLHNKHIPAMYLEGSPSQRWALLQGLMDSDGTVHAGPAVPLSRRMCAFSGTNRELVEGAIQLVRSLGFKATLSTRIPTLKGRDCARSWRFQFSANETHPVFRLKRKQALLKPFDADKRARSRTKSITAIVPVKSVPTQCIQVDSPSSLYLFGEHYTVTHNTGFISPILSAHLIGPEAKQNSMLYSAARSRDQASLVFNYLAKSLRMRNDLEGLVEITDSSKKVRGLAMNTEYRALSADATTAYGVSPALTIHDELGQVVGPTDQLFDALETSGGAQSEPLSLIISTQAASDADLLSTLIDDAIRNPTPENVVCLYTTPKTADIFSQKNWVLSNFALGKFRSLKELADAAKKAQRLPAFEAAFRNLYMNQRVSLLQLLVAPSTWAACATPVDDAIFTSGLPVHLGADLSQSRDLTAVVASVLDPDTEVLHVKPFVFTPQEGLEIRAKQDRAPYMLWVEEGLMVALPGKNISYDMVAEYMVAQTEGWNIASMQFDRWRIEMFKKSCKEKGFASDPRTVWQPVGQGFRDMSPRIEVFEGLLIDELIAHGGHPVLNMAAANAVVVLDPAKNKKIEKAKSSARIDPLVAAVMSAYGAVGPPPEDKSVPPVDDKAFFFV